MQKETRRHAIQTLFALGGTMTLGPTLAGTADGATPTTAPAAKRSSTSAARSVPDRRIQLASVPNMRDLGGLRVAGGSVVRGQVIRSTELGDMSDADKPRFAALGVATVHDLRTAGESQQKPDRLPADTRLLLLDVLRDSKVDAAAGVSDLMRDPKALASTLGNGGAEKEMIESYRDLIRLPSALASYRSFYLDLARPERTGAALFHCTTGKDRTGWAAASLLWLLGADDRTVYADYLQTNTDLQPMIQPALAAAKKAGVDPKLLEPVLTVRRSYLDAAVAQMKADYGTFDQYLHKGLGLTDDTIAAIRKRLVRPD